MVELKIDILPVLEVATIRGLCHEIPVKISFGNNSNGSSFTSLNLGPAIDLNGRDDFISDFKVSPNSTYFKLDSDTYTLNFNLKELLMMANL